MASRLISKYLSMVKSKHDGLMPAHLRLTLVIGAGVQQGKFVRYDETNGIVELKIDGFTLPCHVLDTGVLAITGEIIED